MVYEGGCGTITRGGVIWSMKVGVELSQGEGSWSMKVGVELSQEEGSYGLTILLIFLALHINT